MLQDQDFEILLATSAREYFNGPNRNSLSVNNVRKYAEDKKGLSDGFFTSDAWKCRSKQIIKEVVDKLLAATESAPSSSPVRAQNQSESGAESPQLKKAEPKNKIGSATAAKPKAVEKRKPATRKKKRAKYSSDESELSEPSLGPSNAEPGDDSLEADDEDEHSEEETPQPKKKQKKESKSAPIVDERKAVGNDDADESELSEASGPKAKSQGQKRKARKLVKEDDAEVEENIEVSSVKKDGIEEEEESPLSNVAESVAPARPTAAAPKTDDESSELSSVIDDVPPPKKKRKSKAPPTRERKPKVAKKNGNKSSSLLPSVLDDPPLAIKMDKTKEPDARKLSTGKTRKFGGDMSPEDAEIKKFQGHLLKCGVRKIWAFELKKYGDDTQAKIRHLRALLKDVGMGGRFSEAKAAQIKEQRELARELEDVHQMNDLWGLDGRRSRRAAPKSSLREQSDEHDEHDEYDEQNEHEDGEDFSGKKQKKKDDGRHGDGNANGSEDYNDDEDGDDAPKGNSRRRRVRADLAFLDHDECDSD